MTDVEMCLSKATNDLQRRFIQALRDEDAMTALRAYKCSMEGLQQWEQEEKAERLNEEEERNIALQKNRCKEKKVQLKKLNKIFKSKRGRKSMKAITNKNTDKNVSSNSPSTLSNESRNSELSNRNKSIDSSASSGINDASIEEDILSSDNDCRSILEEKIHPSYTFHLYKDEIDRKISQKQDKDNIISRMKKMQPLMRQPFHQFYDHSFLSSSQPNFKSKRYIQNLFKSRHNDKASDTESDSAGITTSLHEAARLGNSELIKCLLDKGGDPNERDGLRRTALHLVCGGFTRLEESVYNIENELKGDVGNEIEEEEKDIGIKLLSPPIHKDERNQKKKKSMFKLLKYLQNRGKSTDFIAKSSHYALISADPINMLTEEESQKIRKEFETERMECLWIILTSSSHSPTLNSVDERGRTALHYAAELGRENICSTLLGQNNVILTIIDENGRTPCELAAMHGHKHLAAQLEARALIGGGEDMMVLAGWSMLQEDNFGRSEEVFLDAGVQELAPPFSWFDTLENVEGIRTYMIEETKSKLEYILSKSAIKFEEGNPYSSLNISRFNSSLKTRNLASLDDENELHQNINTYFLSQFHKLTPNQTSQLLASFKWDQNALLDSFKRFPGKTLSDAQISPVSSHYQSRNEDYVCLICREEYESNSPEWIALRHCGHSFCKQCLSDYISSCAKGRDVGILSVPCPHHECSVFMDINEIEKFTGSTYNESYETLLQIENENFVAKARDYTFCPSPSCNGIVQCLMPDEMKEKYGEDCSRFLGAVCTLCPRANDTIVRTYEGVLDSNYNSLVEMPKKAHRFCLTCKEKPHWPTSCEVFREWKQKVAEECNDIGSEGYEDVAQSLWMKANTTPCPKCNIPIEKIDGCNHMTCTSCKHEFCWICRQDWKLHNTKTGGFYRCNRWQGEDDENVSGEDSRDIRESMQLVQAHPTLSDEFRYGTSLNSARIARKRNKAMARFLHHFKRWSAHKESANLERKMQDSVCERLAMVVLAASEYGEIDRSGTLGNGLSFVHAAFTELLECRSMLEHTYPFAFYRYVNLPPIPYRMNYPREIEKVKFELLQSELEMITEQMSDIVARRHLRATMTQIMFLTSAGEEKRRELTLFMIELRHGHRKRKTSERKKKPNVDEINNETLMQLLANTSFRPNTRMNASGSINIQFDTAPANMNAFGQQEQNRNQEDFEFQLAVQASIRSHIAVADNDACVDRNNNNHVDGWTCEVCTYLNRGGLLCAICGSRRSD